MKFITHNNTVVKGNRLKKALNKVAYDWRDNAINIFIEDPYAPHVSAQQKIDDLVRRFKEAEEVARGNIKSFTMWQRVDTELTGECIGLLQK